MRISWIGSRSAPQEILFQISQLGRLIYRQTDWLVTSGHADGCQVLGLQLDKPVDAVVCWAKSTGGTQQAISIARAQNISVINMIHPEFSTAELVWAELHRISKQKESYESPSNHRTRLETGNEAGQS